jgi:hypothetical protein
MTVAELFAEARSEWTAARTSDAFGPYVPTSVRQSYEQLQKRGGTRTLAFCVSQRGTRRDLRPPRVARTTRPAALPCALVASRASRASCWMAWGTGIVAGSSGTSMGAVLLAASRAGRRCR